MKICDLHTHSKKSDGTFLPSKLAEAAAKCGLSAVALTDHNTVRGLQEFMDAGERLPIVTVPGCEFTTEHEKTELHLVGLFLPRDKWAEIGERMRELHASKRKNNDRMLALLRADGYEVTREEVETVTDAEEFNRAPVAEILMRKGYVSSIKEAFRTLLPNEGSKYYTPSKRLNTLDVIRYLHSIGAVSVLAHPFLNMDEAHLRAFLTQAVDAGLCAMETHYSTFDAQTTRKAEQIAAQFGIAQSGGSDFHGTRKPEISLGSGTGSLCVPFAFYERLAAIAADLRK